MSKLPDPKAVKEKAQRLTQALQAVEDEPGLFTPKEWAQEAGREMYETLLPIYGPDGPLHKNREEVQRD